MWDGFGCGFVGFVVGMVVVCLVMFFVVHCWSDVGWLVGCWVLICCGSLVCLGLVLLGGFFLVVGVFLLWLLCVWGLFVWLLFCCSLLVGCWMAVLFVCLIVGLFVVCLFACLVLPSVREPPRTGGSPVAQIPILRSIRRRTTHTHNITRLHPLRIYHITRLHPLHPLRLYKHNQQQQLQPACN